MSKVERHWPVWAGSVDDLRRLATAFEELAAQPFAEELAQFESKTHSEDRFAERDRAEMAERWQVRAGVGQPLERKSLVGEPSKVLDKCDPKLMEGFSLTAGREPYGSEAKLSVSMRKTEGRSYERAGVELRIEGYNYGWVQEADNRLSGAIKHGIPWWWPLQAPWIAPTIYVGVSMGVGVLIASAFTSGWGLLGGATWGFNAGFWVVARLARRLLPVFEVVPAGYRPTGSRVIGVIGGLITQVVIGVAIALAFHH
jgi:hypothetical protein